MTILDIVAALRVAEKCPDEAEGARQTAEALNRIGLYLVERGVSYDQFHEQYAAWAEHNADELDTFLVVPVDELAPVFAYLFRKLAPLEPIERIFHLEFLARHDLDGLVSAHEPRFFQDYYVDDLLRSGIYHYACFLRVQALQAKLDALSRRRK